MTRGAEERGVIRCNRGCGRLEQSPIWLRRERSLNATKPINIVVKANSQETAKPLVTVRPPRYSRNVIFLSIIGSTFLLGVSSFVGVVIFARTDRVLCRQLDNGQRFNSTVK